MSDYFYPKAGGVESHIYCVAQSLAKRNHRVRLTPLLLCCIGISGALTQARIAQVVVITHAYPPRNGVRWLPNGVKVYYIPVQPLPPTHVHATLPNFFTALPHIRSILVRESIDVVHAHASLSALGMEAIMHARAMGIRAVFTDHSLFGLGNMAEIWGNKMLKGCLSDVEAVICVSHTGSVHRTPSRPSDPSTSALTSSSRSQKREHGAAGSTQPVHRPRHSERSRRVAVPPRGTRPACPRDSCVCFLLSSGATPR